MSLIWLQSNKSYRVRLPGKRSQRAWVMIWRLKSFLTFSVCYFVRTTIHTLFHAGEKHIISQHVTRILFVMDQLSKLSNFSFSLVFFAALFLYRCCFGVYIWFKFLRNKSKQWHPSQHQREWKKTQKWEEKEKNNTKLPLNLIHTVALTREIIYFSGRRAHSHSLAHTHNFLFDVVTIECFH